MMVSCLSRILCLALLVVGPAACRQAPTREPADLLLVNGRVHTFAWDEPAADGTPAANAPHGPQGWRPDAEAVAIKGGRIVFTGSSKEAEAYRGPATRLVDLGGATALPGLVDSHVHIRELGQMETYLDLTGVQTEAEAVDRVVAFAAKVPKGEWIVGRGWDEGAWANRYPTMALLSEKVPDHPVVLASLHGFGVWGNQLAFAQAKITRATTAPTGGVIVKDAKGEPSGVLLNRATPLLQGAVPPPTPEQAKAWVLAGLKRMAKDGFVAVHEAGADSELMRAFESLRAEGQLPTRVYAMLSAREPALCREWQAKGPLIDPEGMLTVRSVKAYYDGSLGSRGARLIEDYADQQGHRGVSGGSYGFDQAVVADMMKAGFQVGIHAIGDAGNRETLDFIQRIEGEQADVRNNRNRIEHAQVVHPDDFSRFASQQVIASMEPPHAVEDKPWAEVRLGAERVKGAYAWRTFRQAGVRLIFNSDLTGSDHGIFYGLHSAITRRDKTQQPPGGWYPDQRMTPEEAVRGYSTWAAYASFTEKETGILAPGRWADITVMDIDPLTIGIDRPGDLLDGQIRMTIVGGKIVYEAGR
jgi:predicted amidohydrolase YtcJ